MCEHGHKHTTIETWATPETSRHLSSKMVTLFPGDHIHPHTTGPGREEVIVCIYGTIEVCFADSSKSVTSGETLFVPENTLHSVFNTEDIPAQYCYVVTKRDAPVALLNESDEPSLFSAAVDWLQSKLKARNERKEKSVCPAIPSNK